MNVGGTELALSVGGAISLVVVTLAWVKRTGVTLRPGRAEPLLIEAGERSA